jgi:hypothetical protein
MELPNVSSIDSYPSEHQDVRSITSLDDSALHKKLPQPISFANGKQLAESIPSPDADPHQFVTSIEYLVDGPDIEESNACGVEQPFVGRPEYEFIQKVAIDRNKLFKLHYNIQQPEKQLIEETLDHFQKRSNDLPKQSKGQDFPLPLRRKDSELTTSYKTENQVGSRPPEARKSKKVLPDPKKAKKSRVNDFGDREGACDGRPGPAHTLSHKNPNQRSDPSLHDKENVRPDLQQRLSTRPMTKKLKTILQGLKPQEKQQSFCENVSTVNRSPSVNNNTIPEEESICVCDEILARLEESNLGMEAGLFKEIMDRLNTVSRQIQGFENQFRSLKGENQQLREQLMALEASQIPSTKRQLKTEGRDRRVILRPQDPNNFAFKTQTSTRPSLTSKKTESDYRLHNTALVQPQSRSSQFLLRPLDHSRTDNFATAIQKKAFTKTQQAKVATQIFEPRVSRRASHHYGVSVPFA